MGCADCALHTGAITNCLGGKGPLNADVMVVGEAPGAREDVAGVPFVGDAGKLLDAMLADAGYDPATLRITNAIRCRPENNRHPFPSEIDACRKHLEAEIRRVNPKLIIALGDVALRALTKTPGIGSHRGGSLPLHREFGEDIAGLGVWPTYHPAFVLHGAAHARDVIVADLRRIRASATPEEAVPYRIWDGSPLRGGMIAFDIETLDEDGQIVEWPTQCAVASDEDGVLVTTDVAGMSLALVAAQARGAWTVGHNSWDFDVKKMRRFHTPAFSDGLDTMTMAYLDGEQQPLGLEALCVKYLKVRGWKDDGRKNARLGTPEFEHYNARDAYYTLLLCKMLLDRLGPQRRVLVALLQRLRRALDACTERGLRINAAAVEAVRPGYEATIAEQAAVLRALAGDDWRDPEKTYKPGAEHNPNAALESARVLESRGAYLPQTASGKPSTARGTLNRIVQMDDDEYAVALLAYREAKKAHSTYVVPYAKLAAEGDGRAHSRYTIARTATNRTSASGPNVQNLDRDLDFFEGIYKADYSAIEFRTAAWCAREPTIIENYKRDPEWDPHRFFASGSLYRRQQITDLERQIAKSANFSQLYLGGAPTLIEYCAKLPTPITLSLEEAVWIHQTWHATFPAFRSWYFATERFVQHHGYIETATGFRRHFGDYNLYRTQSARDAVKREAVNCLSQTLAAHIAYIGLATCHERGYPVNGFFHDGISFEYADQQAFERDRQGITDALCAEPVRVLLQHFGVAFDVPLVVKFSA